MQWLPYCTGKAIKCMELWLTDFGRNASIVTNDVDKRYSGKRCLPSCKYQVPFSATMMPIMSLISSTGGNVKSV